MLVCLANVWHLRIHFSHRRCRGGNFLLPQRRVIDAWYLNVESYRPGKKIMRCGTRCNKLTEGAAKDISIYSNHSTNKISTFSSDFEHVSIGWAGMRVCFEREIFFFSKSLLFEWESVEINFCVFFLSRAKFLSSLARLEETGMRCTCFNEISLRSYHPLWSPSRLLYLLQLYIAAPFCPCNHQKFYCVILAPCT